MRAPGQQREQCRREANFVDALRSAQVSTVLRASIADEVSIEGVLDLFGFFFADSELLERRFLRVLAMKMSTSCLSAVRGPHPLCRCWSLPLPSLDIDVEGMTFAILLGMSESMMSTLSGRRAAGVVASETDVKAIGTVLRVEASTLR